MCRSNGKTGLHRRPFMKFQYLWMNCFPQQRRIFIYHLFLHWHLPPALSFSFSYARCIIRAQTTHTSPLLGLFHLVFAWYTLPIVTQLLFFLSLPGISIIWSYILSHSDISNSSTSNAFLCQLSSADAAALGPFRGAATNLPFFTVLETDIHSPNWWTEADIFFLWIFTYKSNF